MASQIEKWAEEQGRLAVVREFLEWLDEQRLEVAAWKPSGNACLPIIEDREHLLARFVGVDLQKLEVERRALLADAIGTNRQGA